MIPWSPFPLQSLLSMFSSPPRPTQPMPHPHSSSRTRSRIILPPQTASLREPAYGYSKNAEGTRICAVSTPVLALFSVYKQGTLFFLLLLHCNFLGLLYRAALSCPLNQLSEWARICNQTNRASDKAGRVPETAFCFIGYNGKKQWGDLLFGCNR